ncbi:MULTISPECIES: HAD family hydrolase [Streptomyces]|uniref:Hydrolase n=1 Tax=Streptomyces albus (strain ATCC 21838 / DSM 41398 / FERM P-419 / JCM 4703 / NBRC 107858) TaxID=1081613 RepID=A0A0B5EZR6_STRA4|nr:HAD family hydrolase [Streptomyces sp. SCSIO ZS0520]AJE84116.1 hydrolase [Streptomyces albus]AOU78421.1 hydrolase [Streptomyces albus]AYN34169.1 HAD family hydrolase [Streptomyces albus]
MTTAGAPGFPYRLVATDLDGTLLRGDGTVSPRTREALSRVTAAGAAHLVVTGRAVTWTKPILEGLGYQGLAVCLQGGQLYDAGADRLLSSVTLDRQLAALALARIEAETGPLALAVCRDGVDGEVLIGPGYRTLEGLRATWVDRPEDLFTAPLGKVYLQHPELGDDELTAIARKVAGDLVDVTMAGSHIVSLLPLGLNKATGLRLAARRLGLGGAEAIAFGDMPNDLPMFRWAGHAVAMADAHPEVRAAADEVTASNEEDGVAVVLERLLAAAGEPDPVG